MAAAREMALAFLDSKYPKNEDSIAIFVMLGEEKVDAEELREEIRHQKRLASQRLRRRGSLSNDQMYRHDLDLEDTQDAPEEMDRHGNLDLEDTQDAPDDDDHPLAIGGLERFG